MKAQPNNSLVSKSFLIALTFFGALGIAGDIFAQAKANATAPGPVKQKTFPTSQAAADALIQAAAKFDVSELLAIVGPNGADLVVTKDHVQDKERAATFSAKALEKTSVTKDPKNA
ncbi:MAG TPA: DUF2950 family protein, partial [Pyrinomonadaceae bacterium]|nr:DUF2950 family protein [Pyrinomonadaceae bacterium]